MNIIQSESVRKLVKTIKSIQKRMMDSDLVSAEYITVYSVLSEEFKDFSDSYPELFKKVTSGTDIQTVSSILYFRDRYERGLITEEQLAQMLNKRYIPAHILDTPCDVRRKEEACEERR